MSDVSEPPGDATAAGLTDASADGGATADGSGHARTAALLADLQLHEAPEAHDPPLAGAELPALASHARARREQRERRRRRWARIGFGSVIAVLILAVPVLGYVGKTLVLDSTDGKILNNVQDPKAAGFEALVEATPTMLLAQTTGAKKLDSLSLLALGAGDAGGSVTFIPVESAVVHAANGVDRLTTAFALGGSATLKDQTEQLLKVGADSVVVLDDAGWAKAVAPVAPITIQNPDSVTGPGGQAFAAGPLSLTAEQVGPYLAAKAPGESDLNRLARQRIFWTAWLAAVKAKGSHAVGGPASLQAFVTTLAKGAPTIATLPVIQSDSTDGGPRFIVDPGGTLDAMGRAVPFPRAPASGGRTTVRVLNAVRPGTVSADVTSALVRAGAVIQWVGNASRFGQRTTRILYSLPENKVKAQAMRDALGVGTVVQESRSDSIDVTVEVGADLANGPVPTPTTVAPTGGTTGG